MHQRSHKFAYTILVHGSRAIWGDVLIESALIEEVHYVIYGMESGQKACLLSSKPKVIECLVIMLCSLQPWIDCDKSLHSGRPLRKRNDTLGENFHEIYFMSLKYETKLAIIM